MAGACSLSSLKISTHSPARRDEVDDVHGAGRWEWTSCRPGGTIPPLPSVVVGVVNVGGQPGREGAAGAGGRSGRGWAAQRLEAIGSGALRLVHLRGGESDGRGGRRRSWVHLHAARSLAHLVRHNVGKE